MANQKATQLTENTIPATGDLVYMVDDPGGTPGSVKVTYDNFAGNIPANTLNVGVGQLQVIGGNVAVSGTVDGRDLATDGTKLDGIASGAIANVVEDITPQLGGQLDVNGNAIGDGTRELLTFVEDGSAVNQVEIENEATGSGPIIRAAGDNTDIDLNIDPKGTGAVKLDGLSWPTADGAAGQVLKTDGAAALSFGAALPGDTYWGDNLLYNTDLKFDADAAQPIYWDEEDANVTLTKEDAAGESIPEKHLQVFKVVNGVSGGGKYVKQTLIHANEDLLDDSVTVISAGVWVFSASAGTMTLELFDNGGAASLGTATTTTTGAWIFLEIIGVTLGTTSTDIRIDHSVNSATMDLVLPMMNVGTEVLPWQSKIVSDILIIEDQKAANTQGGTATSGSFQTRDLNTVIKNTITGASLATNQITLPIGAYQIWASAPAFVINAHHAQLQNVTDASTVLNGTSEAASTGGIVQTRSIVNGFFLLSDSKAFEIQHRVATTRASDGFGSASNMGVLEVYTIAKIIKVA